MSAGDIRDTDLMLYANTSIRRRDALECPFDASFARIHDVEAGQRLLAKGFRPRFVPKAVVYELFTKDVKGVLRDSRLQGKFEVILFQRFPRFRALAGIARINEGNVLKRFVRKQLALHPVLSEFILRPAFAIAEALRAQPTFASLARRILKARAANQHLSGAIREAGSWRSIEEQFGKRVPVLLYHNAGVPKPGEYPGLTTPAEEFERQIQFLVRMGYEGIRPAEWLRWRDEGEELPRRPIMLVFDDAYEEAARIAFPIIEKHGFGAACMVVTGCVGATNRWDEMAGRPSFPLMPRDQIVGWSRRGIEFGGHTRNHPYLPDEPAERVRQEIAECRDDLTELLGQAPTSFAYPFGGVSAAAETAAREHFAIAFTVWPGVLTLASNPHVVPRIEFLTGESRLGMWCRLRLGKNPMEVARNRWRKLLGERRGRSVPTGGWAKSSIERVQDGHDLSR
ncbi:MAG TPA: polysaccharide deacetylase family protein [Terracidiphilus sp.]|nr:polysaccharide deacetylase family protein [Terracidiphilus sp.]